MSQNSQTACRSSAPRGPARQLRLGGQGNGQLSYPRASRWPTGTVYVADTRNERLQECKAGEPPTFAATFSHTESREVPFGEPNAVAVDSSANIWAADSAHDHLLQFNSSREYVRELGSEGTANGQFKGIGGIAANASGDVYASDTGNDRIQEFSSAGTLRALLRLLGAGQRPAVLPNRGGDRRKR